MLRGTRLPARPRIDRAGGGGRRLRGRPRGHAEGGGPPAVPVEIQTVRSALQRDTSEYVANLISRHSVRVQPQVDGHVTRIDVVSGDRVRAGAPLMLIDPRRQQAAVHSQQAATEAAGATLAYWRDQYRRIERLYAGGGASRQELDQARSSLQQAEANTNSSEAQVRAQSVELRYYEVVAPGRGYRRRHSGSHRRLRVAADAADHAGRQPGAGGVRRHPARACDLAEARHAGRDDRRRRQRAGAQRGHLRLAARRRGHADGPDQDARSQSRRAACARRSSRAPGSSGPSSRGRSCRCWRCRARTASRSPGWPSARPTAA